MGNTNTAESTQNGPNGSTPLTNSRRIDTKIDEGNEKYFGLENVG